MDNKSEKVLYYCISYYQVYIAIIKALLNKCLQQEILLSDAIPKVKELYEKLVISEIFSKVYIIYEKDFVYKRRAVFKMDYKKLNMLKKFFIGKFMWVKSQNDIIDFGRRALPIVDMDYREIYVFGEGRSFAPLLHSIGEKFILVEDALNYYQKKANKDNLIERNRMNKPRKFYVVNSLLDKMGVYYYMGGYSTAIKGIEVNEVKELVLVKRALRKVYSEPRQKLVEKLTTEQRELIYKTFLDNKIMHQTERNSYIVLTNPLVFDKLVETEKEAIRIYQMLINEFCKEASSIYIKPHPRDDVDYLSNLKVASSQKIILLERYIPSEILGFNKETRFKKALAISSTAIEQASFAEKGINVGMNWLDEKVRELTDI